MTDGKCAIRAKSKQICKKCRYDKCVEVGMDSKWVLTNEEKRVRFKNFFKKKDELAMLGPAPDSEAPVEESRPSGPRGQANKRRRAKSGATTLSR